MRALKAVGMGYVCLASFVALPRLAWAQTSCSAAGPCILGPADPVRALPGGSVQPARTLSPTGINYADCTSNLDLEFSLPISNSSTTDTLQVWVGPYSGTTGSASATTGSSGTAPCIFPTTRAEQCWPALAGSVTPLATTPITVRAQDIVQYLDQTPSSTYVMAGASACEAQTIPGPISLGIYFMFLATDGTVDGTASVYQLPVATLGPYAPANVTLTAGDQSGTVSWTPPNDPTDSVEGYYVYCQNDGDAGTGTGSCTSSILESTFEIDASTSTDAATSSDAATLDAGADADAEFVAESGTTVPVTPAGISQISSSFLCAPLVQGNSATAAPNALTLKNFDHYVFAVAAVDELGNIGAVGNLVCGTPGPIQDFWFDYVQDGGQAGGGYCALEGVGMPAGGSCMAIGVGLGAIGFMRRRRRTPRREERRP